MPVTTLQNDIHIAQIYWEQLPTGSELAVKAQWSKQRLQESRVGTQSTWPLFFSYIWNYLHAATKSLTVFEIRNWKERFLRALVLIMDVSSNGGKKKKSQFGIVASTHVYAKAF